MSLENLNILIGIGYTILAAVVIFINLRRNTKSDDTSEANTITTIIIKLETINTGLAELKAELTMIRKDYKEDHDRITIIEQKLDSAWKEIDKLNSQFVHHGQ